ncbi:unnamed protein product [Citrullus colocynthis]|uniref:Uncharacterized protein n=1 Tax=Citrullus colocynthis TaxID=252529 RepID=A0ABP0YA35_9ROSI
MTVGSSGLSSSPTTFHGHYSGHHRGLIRVHCLVSKEGQEGRKSRTEKSHRT